MMGYKTGKLLIWIYVYIGVVCTEDSCPDFDELVNGEIFYMVQEINRLYHVAEIVCNDNYDLFPDIPDGFNECIEADTWEYPEFTCEERCEVPRRKGTSFYYSDGEIVKNKTIKHDVELRKKCGKGYEDLNQETVKCDKGTLRGSSECTPTSEPFCPDFDELVNGAIYYMSEEINKVYHVAEIKCNDNYDLFPDIPDGYNECVANNTWEYPEFTCEGRLAVGPGNKMYLYYGTGRGRGRRIYSPKVVKSRTMLTSTCYTNYELYDESTKTYVDKRYLDYKVVDGKLQPNMASCVEERCEVPRRTGTSFYTSDGDLVRTGHKIEHDVELQKRCDKGYVDLKQEKVKCDKGTLRGSSECTKKRCQIPEDRGARSRYVTYSADSFIEHGVTVYKSCTQKEELYYPDQQIYDDDQKFYSKCNYGTWTEPTFPVCKERRCTVYRKRGTLFYTSDGQLVKSGQKIEHGVVLQKKCKDKYEDLKQREVKCDRGTLRGSGACTPKRCQIPEGRDARKSRSSRELLEENSFVENGVTVYKRCENRKELYYPDQQIYDDDQKFESKCNYGTWTEPTFPVCIQGCLAEIVTGTTYEYQDGTRIEYDQLVHNGTSLLFICYDNHNLSYRNKRATRVNASITCLNGNFVPEFKCVSNSNDQNGVKTGAPDINDDMETTTLADDATTPRVDPAYESNYEYYDYFEDSCQITRDIAREMTVFGREMGKKTIYFEGTNFEAGKRLFFNCKMKDMEPVNRIFKCINGHWVSIRKGFNMIIDNDNPECRPVKAASCTSPKNGKLHHSYLSIYEVTCDEGYTLNVIKFEKQFLCVDGKLQSRRLKLEPVCEEDSCKITSDMSWKMKVFGRERGEKTFYSEGFEFKAGKQLYFNCKEDAMEPVNRIFKCIKGRWVAIERDFEMTIDNAATDCRQVDCGPGCQFGGTCVKDGKCDCPPATEGDHCEIPKCQANCTLNGGECIRPNTCKCPPPRYGTICELVGCSPPSGNKVLLEDQRSVFRRDDILRNSDVTCDDELVLSTPEDFVCTGDNIWSPGIACGKGTTYTIEFKVNSHRWSGSWSPMIVSMKTETGNVIGEISFPYAKFPGDTHTGIEQFRYIGKVHEIDITLNTGRGYDTIVMDYMLVTADDEQRHEVYRLTSINSTGARFSQNVEVACSLPQIDGEYKSNKKESYFSGDSISSNDIQCKQGLSPSLPAVTCQTNGQWTGSLTCAPEAEYNVAIHFGSSMYAGEYGGTLTLTFKDSDRQNQVVLSISGGLDPNAKITMEIEAVYIPEITSLDLHITGYVKPSVQIETIHLKVDKSNDGKEYIFTDIGWVNPKRTISPDPGCKPPSVGMDVLVPNNNYLTNDKMRSDDVRCKDGYHQRASEVTCLKTGKWSDQLCAMPRPELVRGIVITSSTTHSTWEAQRAVDGNTIRTPDTCECCAATTWQYEPWYKVDLGRLYEVHSLIVLGRGGDSDRGFGQTFENMRITYGQTNYDEDELVSNYRNDYVYNETFAEPKLARYLQLILVGRTRHFIICELLVYGVHSPRDSPQPRSNERIPVSENNESYDVKILSSTRVNRRVNIIIKGKDANTKAMVFSDSGLVKGVNEKTFGPIPDIGHVQKVILFRDNGWFYIKYVHVRVHSSGDEYVGFPDEVNEKRAEIEVRKLYKAGCEGTTYTNGIYGYQQSIHHIRSVILSQSLDQCTSACTRNERCRAVRYRRGHRECYVISTNKLSNFMFSNNYNDGEIYFRAC